MRPLILYRESELAPGELAAMHRHFKCTKLRADIQPGNLVIGRYSVLPFYQEQAEEVEAQGGRLINSVGQHRYVADLGAWYPDLDGYTFPTWESLESTPKGQAPFVLKGQTNSMKHLWKSHMYAATWEDAVQVYGRLIQDALIGTQRVYIRKYVHLETLGATVTGLPITYEFRVFVLFGKVVNISFYWGSFAEDLDRIPTKPYATHIPSDWLEGAIARVSDHIPFFTIDVACDVNGQWWVVELNDGQMAGLNGADPEEFYARLAEHVEPMCKGA